MISIALATEDVLTEAIGKILVREHHQELQISTLLRKGGSGYLRSRLSSFCDMSRYQPIFLITDLDQIRCPIDLIEDWFGPKHRPTSSLLFRVAVREVESWLLADHQAISRVFSKRSVKLPDRPDELDDPKRYLVRLAEKAPRSFREAIVPEPGSKAVQGLGYNQELLSSVLPHWNPIRAEQRSDSLRRARSRLAEFAKRMRNANS